MFCFELIFLDRCYTRLFSPFQGQPTYTYEIRMDRMSLKIQK